MTIDLSKIDLSNIAYKTSSLMSKILMGQKINTKEYEIKINIPRELAETFEELGETLNVKIEDLLTQIAMDGFNKTLFSSINEISKNNPFNVTNSLNNKDTSTLDTLKELGVDTNGITEGLKKIERLASEIGQLQKVVEENVDSTTTKKNTSQFGISLREISGCNSKK